MPLPITVPLFIKVTPSAFALFSPKIPPAPPLVASTFPLLLISPFIVPFSSFIPATPPTLLPPITEPVLPASFNVPLFFPVIPPTY